MFILPVSATIRDIKYPDPVIPSKEKLEKMLRGEGIQINIVDDLSHENNHLYAGMIEGRPVIVKHIEQRIPKTPVEFFIMVDGHAVEAKVLKKLQGTDINVPELIQAVPKLTTNIIEDLREKNYVNLSTMILRKKLPLGTAGKIGTALGKLAHTSKQWTDFNTEASSARIYFTHSLELLVAFPHNLDLYEALRTSFVLDMPENDEETTRGFVWSESNPQHVMVNKDGDISFIDFSDSFFGDQRFMISQMIAHIIAYAHAGYIKASDAATYLSELVKAYLSVTPIRDEEIAVRYIAMELLHVSNGKDIEGIDTTKQVLNIQSFARDIFDKEMKTIKQVLSALKKA